MDQPEGKRISQTSRIRYVPNAPMLPNFSFFLFLFFKIKTGKITRGHDFTLVKGQNRLDFRKYSFSQRTVNEWNKLSADCVHSSSVNMFKNRIDNYLVRAGYT